MPKNTLPNDYLMQQEYRDPLVIEKMMQKVAWLDFMPMQESTSEIITATRELYSADDDPEGREPSLRTSGSRFTRVAASGKEEISTFLSNKGFEVVIDERMRKYAANAEDIDKRYTRAASWLAKYVGAKVITTLKSASKGVTRLNSNMSFYNRSIVKWSASSGVNPINDFLLLVEDVENQGTGYKATDFYIAKGKFNAMMKWLVALNVEMETKREIYGVPRIQDESIYIPALDATIHKIRTGLDEGDVLVLDRNVDPCKWYYGYNQEFSPITTFASEDGTQLQNVWGLHSHQYMDDENHDVMIQFWLECGILTKDQLGGIFTPAGTYGI
jgi:hypothetical protein